MSIRNIFKWIYDKFTKEAKFINTFVQVGLFVLAILGFILALYGYFFTVLPLYKISKLEMEVDKQSEEIKKNAIEMYFQKIALSPCFGALNFNTSYRTERDALRESGNLEVHIKGIYGAQEMEDIKTHAFMSYDETVTVLNACLDNSVKDADAKIKEDYDELLDGSERHYLSNEAESKIKKFKEAVSLEINSLKYRVNHSIKNAQDSQAPLKEKNNFYYVGYRDEVRRIDYFELEALHRLQRLYMSILY